MLATAVLTLASCGEKTAMSLEVDGKTYFNERPVSTQQSGFVYVSQMRSWLPREIGGVLWFGNDDANMVCYTPVYCSATKIPTCFDTPGADAVTFSMDNAFWVCNWVSNMVYPRYAQMFVSLEAVRDSLDNSWLANQAAVEAKAAELMTQQGSEAAVKYLNDYSCQKGDEMIARWRQLATYLIVKYNDMVVKKENADGTFQLSKHGIGERPVRPGYPKRYAKELVKQLKPIDK